MEIETYQNEENVWVIDAGISNSGGNLCLHLIGNLNAFIGAELGKTGYIRNRELEFSAKNIPKNELVAKIEDTITAVDMALSNLDPAKLEEDYPVLVFKEKTATGHFLTHLATHLTYHLGQINYHRRLLDT